MPTAAGAGGVASGKAWTVQGELEEGGLHSLELRLRNRGRCDNSL